MSKVEQTLSIIKPDAVERNLENEIKEMFKHNGFLIAIIDGLPTFFSAILKLIFYYLLNHKRKKIYYQRVSGFLNALVGKKSYYRPKINNQCPGKSIKFSTL